MMKSKLAVFAAATVIGSTAFAEDTTLRTNVRCTATLKTLPRWLKTSAC